MKNLIADSASQDASATSDVVPDGKATPFAEEAVPATTLVPVMTDTVFDATATATELDNAAAFDGDDDDTDEHRKKRNWPKLPKVTKVGKKLHRAMMRTIQTWELIQPGDRIMVCLSGGKDSYTLYDLLWQACRRAPFDFELIGVHLDQGQPGYDGNPLENWLDDFGAPYEILGEDTYSIVKDKTKDGQAYCVVCSRLRRGILYGAAERLGCNKIALGHHRDDALETLLMNLLYSGKMQAMPAVYTTDDSKFDVIRPLIDCAERDIVAYSEERAFPILPCNLCGSQDGLKRERVRALLNDLEGETHDVRAVMHHALQNVRPSHLLDKDVRDVWMARPADVRPVADAQSSSTTANRISESAKVKKSGGLPILG